MQNSEDQTTSFKEKLLNNTSLLTKRLNSNHKLKTSQISSARNLKSSSVKDMKQKEIVFLEDSEEKGEEQATESQESQKKGDEYIEEFQEQESDEFKDQLDKISSKIMKKGSNINNKKESKESKRQIQAKRGNPQKQRLKQRLKRNKGLRDRIQGRKQFTSNAKIPEKKQRMKRNLELKNQANGGSLNRNISESRKSSKSKKKKKRQSNHEASKRNEEHRPEQITKPIYLKSWGNGIQTPPQDFDQSTHCELKERQKGPRKRRVIGPQKLKERFQQKELIDLQNDEESYQAQPKNIKKDPKKQKDVKECYFKIEIEDGYPVARPLSELELKKNLVSRHSQTTIALPDILLAQKPQFKEVAFSIKLQLQNFATKEEKKKNKKLKSEKLAKSSKTKQKNFQTQFYEQTPEEAIESEKDPDVMIAESRPEQIESQKQKDQQEEVEEVEAEEREDVVEVQERNEEQVEKINLGSKSLLEIVEILKEEELITDTKLLQKFRNNHTHKNTMEFLSKFTSGKLQSFNFKNSPFTLADHRRISELLTSLFPHKYQIGSIISSNIDIQTFLSSLYTLKAKKYFQLYKTIQNISKITWWEEIMKKNEQAIKRSLSKNSGKNEPANQNKMKMSQISKKIKGSQPAPILRNSTVSKKKVDFCSSMVKQVII